MALARIGPVVMDHRNPSFDFTSPADRSGIRTCRIGGQSSQASVTRLSELVANGQAVQTIAGHTGILEYLDLTGDLVGPYRGWYLLEPFGVQIQRPWDVTPFTPFSLDAACLGDSVEVIIEASSVTMPNDWGHSGTGLVYDYFDGPLVLSASSGPEREYDASFPHSTGAYSEPAA